MPEQQTGTRIGEILQALGVVNHLQLKEAIRLAGEVAVPLGRALVLYGYIVQEDLDLALEIQTLVKNKSMPISIGAQAFKIARRDKKDLGVALAEAGFSGSTISQSASRLGALLLDAGLVTQEQLDLAQRSSRETGQPIGKMLVYMGIMTQELIDAALDAQKNYREERISYSQALTKLTPEVRAPNRAMNTTSAAAVEQGGPKKIRLGEFLLMAGLLNESDVMNALEYGLARPELPFGAILIELGLLTQSLLDLALTLQTRVCENTLSLASAIDTFYSYTIGRVEAEQAPESQTIRLGELLKMSGIISDLDVEQAIALSSRYPSVIGKMLVLSGSITEATLLAALRCQFLMRRQIISVDQAVEALKHAEIHKMSLDDSLEEIAAPRGSRS